MNVYLPFTARLPSAYQEVEYIQSSGTQYMIIGTSFKTSYKTVIDFQMTQIGGDYIPLGLNNQVSSSNRYRYGVDVYGGYFKVITGSSSDWSNTKAEDTNRHTLTIDNSTATMDSSSYTISGYRDYTYSKGIGVFAYNDSTIQFHSSVKIYKLDIYDENGTHIYDLVPCYRKSDSVIGLYDLVNNQFYTNSGTGTFSKGNDVTMAELKGAYIGEFVPYTPGANTLFYYNIDDNDTTSTLYDKTGNLNMTWNAAPTYSIDSKVGRYVHGFSTSVFAKASKYVNFGTEYTMSCLVYFDSSWTWGVLFSQGESSSLSPDKTLEFGDLDVFFRTTRGDNPSVYTEANPGVNRWSVYTFVCSQTGNYRKIYVNGVEIATATYLNTTTLDGAYPSIGVWTQRTCGAPMLGYMKNLLGENKAWTAQEIQDYYNNTKSLYGL